MVTTDGYIVRWTVYGGFTTSCPSKLADFVDPAESDSDEVVGMQVRKWVRMLLFEWGSVYIVV
jgi:hypothetical protein